MLVRRGMEDDGRGVSLEDLAHLRPVAAIAEHRRDGGELAVRQQLPLDVEESGLGVVHEDESRRRHARDLTAELRADRAAGTSHEHCLAGEVRRDRGQVDLDRFAS